MSQELSHQGATTGNTYIDLGADTAEGYSISSRSRMLARQMVGNATLEDRIRQRCSTSVGDFAMADLMRFVQDPIDAGLNALMVKAPIYTDIQMVKVGIQKKGHSSKVSCILEYGKDLSERVDITRTRAAILELGTDLNGAIIVIGNAPSCLLSLCDLYRSGVRPALVIGCPVGFVNAAESKEELRKLGLPSISTEGPRGGTPVAVASMNEIITIFAEKRN